MSSTQKTAIFMYAGKSFIIPCNGKEKIIDMILKFMQKFNPSSKYINYDFSYEGTKIEKYVHYNEIEKYNSKKLFKKIDKGCEDKNDFFYCVTSVKRHTTDTGEVVRQSELAG